MQSHLFLFNLIITQVCVALAGVALLADLAPVMAAAARAATVEHLEWTQCINGCYRPPAPLTLQPPPQPCYCSGWCLLPFTFTFAFTFTLPQPSAAPLQAKVKLIFPLFFSASTYIFFFCLARATPSKKVQVKSSPSSAKKIPPWVYNLKIQSTNKVLI